jgi:hypothetical protein
MQERHEQSALLSAAPPRVKAAKDLIAAHI